MLSASIERGMFPAAEGDEEGFLDFHIAPGGDFDPNAAWQDVHLLLEEAEPYEIDPLGATVRVRGSGKALALDAVAKGQVSMRGGQTRADCEELRFSNGQLRRR